MKITKLNSDKIKIETRKCLLHTPSDKLYKVIECPCAFLKYIEEVSTKTNDIVLEILQIN